MNGQKYASQQTATAPSSKLSDALGLVETNLMIIENTLRSLRDRLGGAAGENSATERGPSNSATMVIPLLQRAQMLGGDTQVMIGLVNQLAEMI